jgi:hypothetical protein
LIVRLEIVSGVALVCSICTSRGVLAVTKTLGIVSSVAGVGSFRFSTLRDEGLAVTMSGGTGASSLLCCAAVTLAAAFVGVSTAGAGTSVAGCGSTVADARTTFGAKTGRVGTGWNFEWGGRTPSSWLAGDAAWTIASRPPWPEGHVGQSTMSLRSRPPVAVAS